jgi:hypothetical protein
LLIGLHPDTAAILVLMVLCGVSSVAFKACGFVRDVTRVRKPRGEAEEEEVDGEVPMKAAA